MWLVMQAGFCDAASAVCCAAGRRRRRRRAGAVLGLLAVGVVPLRW